MAAEPPVGYNAAVWGASPEQVKSVLKPQSWQGDASTEKGFPEDLKVSVFKSNETVAGYKAVVKYYFMENKFFQVTVVFPFDEFVNYDFNYNVFRSVNEYYNDIRSKTSVFVNDIYELLYKKYGKKEPVFKGLDPKHLFINLDMYLAQERWNLRYHPYDYYLRIKTSAYARWDFPKTRIIFSLSVAASEKRFEYQLSQTSLDLENAIQKKMDSLRMRGL
jgi:hypothetical protein